MPILCATIARVCLSLLFSKQPLCPVDTQWTSLGQPTNKGANSLVLPSGFLSPPESLSLFCCCHEGPPPLFELSNDQRMESSPMWQQSTSTWDLWLISVSCSRTVPPSESRVAHKHSVVYAVIHPTWWRTFDRMRSGSGAQNVKHAFNIVLRKFVGRRPLQGWWGEHPRSGNCRFFGKPCPVTFSHNFMWRKSCRVSEKFRRLESLNTLLATLCEQFANGPLQGFIAELPSPSPFNSRSKPVLDRHFRTQSSILLTQVVQAIQLLCPIHL